MACRVQPFTYNLRISPATIFNVLQLRQASSTAEGAQGGAYRGALGAKRSALHLPASCAQVVPGYTNNLLSVLTTAQYTVGGLHCTQSSHAPPRTRRGLGSTRNEAVLGFSSLA